jgi:outer membrane protein assembly factor BamB
MALQSWKSLSCSKCPHVFVVLITILACDVNTDPSPPPDGDSVYGIGWSATHGDGANSDYSSISVPLMVKLKWWRKFDGTINLGPTSDKDGTVYVTTSAEGCHVYALEVKSGATKWCNDELNEFAVASGVLIDRDQRLFIADDHKMVALDNNGNRIWKADIDGFPFSAQFTQTGRLIFITHIGTIYVLDRTDGKPVLDPVKLLDPATPLPPFDPRACMRGTRDCPCANTPAFDPATGSLYFTFWYPDAAAASLVAMRFAEDSSPKLEMLWRNDNLPGGSASSPDLSGDGLTVYVNDNVNSIHAIESKTGTVRWSYNIGYAPGGSQSTSPDGYIMPGGGDGAKLMCIRDRGDSAELIWKSDTFENRGIVTQSAGGFALATIKTGSFAYDLMIIDVRTGEIYDADPLPGKPLFTVGTTVGNDSSILVPTFNGYLYSFGKDD